MKQNILFLLCLFLMIGCHEDETVDITIMPDETSVGANTFGCLVDGWLYVGGRYSGVHRPSIEFVYSEEQNQMRASVLVKSEISIDFIIDDPEQGKQVILPEMKFGNEVLENIPLTITRFDSKSKIISGVFAGGRVEHGRFDVKYKDLE